MVYFTTCGWMMWNWLVSNLALGATIITYDGAPVVRDRTILWDLVAQERLAVFGTSAKWLALAEKEGLVPGPDARPVRAADHPVHGKSARGAQLRLRLPRG